MTDKTQALWPRELWADAIWEADLKPLQKLIALAYYDHARNGHTSWVTYDRLMKRAGLSRDSVARHLRALVEAGWLTVETPAAQHSATVYRLTYPAQQSVDQTADAPQEQANDEPAPLEIQQFGNQQSDSAVQQSDSAPPAVRFSGPSSPTVGPNLTTYPTTNHLTTSNPSSADEAAGEAAANSQRLKTSLTTPPSRPDEALTVKSQTPGKRPTNQGRGWTPTAQADRTAHTDHWAQPGSTF